MEIRKPLPADASALGEIHVRAWQEGYKGGLMPDDFLRGLSIRERADMWSDALSRSPRERSARLVSVDAAGEVRGFILVGPAEGDANATEGEVYALNVDPAAWGRGHGRSLLAEGAARLRGAGFDQAILWVHSDNDRARRFYAWAGWVDDGAERRVEVLGVKVPETRYRLSPLP